MNRFLYVESVKTVLREKFFRSAGLAKLISYTDYTHRQRMVFCEKFCNSASEAARDLMFFNRDNSTNSLRYFE